MIVRELVSLVGFKVDQSSMARAERSMRAVGGKMQSAGRAMTLALTAPIAALTGGILRVAADFESGMNRVKVLTGATAEEFEMLKEQARDLGATTAFSAKQAADAMGFLAQAGFDVDEIYASMPATLDLAAASQQDLATTADQLSNIMQGFGEEANQAGRVADVLALTASSSNTNVTQLAEAMKYAAPFARSLGVSVEETAAMMGFMGNAGIQASMAGTGLRQAFTRLIKPTKDAQDALNKLGIEVKETGKDGTKSFRNFIDILDELQIKGATVEQLTDIFEIRGFTAIQTIMAQGTDALRDFSDVLIDDAAGTAARQAGVQMAGLKGKMRELKSAIDELAISIGDAGLLEWSTNLAEKLAEITREIAKLDPEMLKMGTRIAGVVAGIPMLVWGLGKVVSYFGILAKNPLVTALVGVGALAWSMYKTIKDPAKAAAAAPGGAARAAAANQGLNFIRPDGTIRSVSQAMRESATARAAATGVSINVENAFEVGMPAGFSGPNPTQAEFTEMMKSAIEESMTETFRQVANDFTVKQ